MSISRRGFLSTNAGGTRAGRLAALALSIGLLAGLVTGCGASGGGSTVTILVAWDGTELTAFTDTVIRGFEAAYPGTTVQVESTRALESDLDTDIEQGSPPDIAALPSTGAISQYAAEGALQPLDGLIDDAAYGQPWQSLIRYGSGRHLYAVPVKADVKSLIWYAPRAMPGPGRPATLAGLQALSRSLTRSGRSPWCLSLSSPPTSGWPGADWIADLILSRDGPASYQNWADGRLSWTSPQVMSAWQEWNALVGTPDATALTTAVGATRPSAAGCTLSHGTLVDQDFPARAVYGRDYAFFPFPSGNSAIQVSADFVGLFRATPAAENLVRYMTSTPAQEKWVSFPGADGFSPDSLVPPSAYSTLVTRAIASLLTSGRELCFGAADAMPPDLGAAFDHAALWDQAQPSALTRQILPALAQVPAAGGTPPQVCGRPSR